MCYLEVTRYKCGCFRSYDEKKNACLYAAIKARYKWDGTWDCPAPEKLTDEEKKTVLKEPDECPACAAKSKRRCKEQKKEMEVRERKEKKDEKEKKKREKAEKRVDS